MHVLKTIMLKVIDALTLTKEAVLDSVTAYLQRAIFSTGSWCM